MTENLPITSWSNESAYIYHLFDTELLTIADIFGLHEEDEPFLFYDYQWYLVPVNYLNLMPKLDETVYANHYIWLKYRSIYWIAERIRE
jgi:hypothetical protein